MAARYFSWKAYTPLNFEHSVNMMILFLFIIHSLCVKECIYILLKDTMNLEAKLSDSRVFLRNNEM